MMRTPTHTQKITIDDVVLYCGDSVRMLEAGILKFDAIVSDPPYGIEFQRGKDGTSFANTYRGTIRGDAEPFDPTPWTRACGMAKPIVLFGADHYKTRLPEGGRFICWDKSVGQGPAAQFTDAEFAWTNRRNARSIFRHFWMGGMRAHDGADGSTHGRYHVSQKPVNLMAWCMDHARIGVGKTVRDPYMGSGSTAIAAIQTGRKFVGVEIDPEIFQTAIARVRKYVDTRHGG